MLRPRHDWRVNLALAVTAAVAAGCAAAPSGDAADETAGPAAVEPTSSRRIDEPLAAVVGAADPDVDAAPQEPEPVPTFADDDPLFEPLPPVEVDPDYPPPEEYVEMLRAVVVDGLVDSARMRATAQLDSEVLGATHDGRAFDRLAARIRALATEGVVERTPDQRFSELVIDYRSHFTVWVHTCVHWGPRSGVYDAESRQMLWGAERPPAAFDLLISRRALPPAEDPEFRIVDVFPLMRPCS